MFYYENFQIHSRVERILQIIHIYLHQNSAINILLYSIHFIYIAVFLTFCSSMHLIFDVFKNELHLLVLNKIH